MSTLAEKLWFEEGQRQDAQPDSHEAAPFGKDSCSGRQQHAKG